MASTGTLILVVGASGVGKDTLIAAAKAQLAGDLRFHFPRRVVTREAVAALEDHDSISGDDFEMRRRDGAFALHWDAHGLRYGVPTSIDAALAAGTSVVVNVSRKIIGGAREKYRRCEVILIEASVGVRAGRLAGRGRETAAEVSARLQREGEALPAGVVATRIDNSASLDAPVAAFVSAVVQLAE